MVVVETLGMVWVVIVKIVRQFAVLIILLLEIAGIACSKGSAPVEPVLAQAAAPPVATASTPPVDQTYTASGPLVVENQVDVAAQREGVVVQILVEPGMRVHVGQLLARLDDRQITADLEAARAKTASTEADLNNWKAEAKVLDADYQRARKMWEAQIIPQEQLEHARYRAEADQWDVKRVEQLLINARDTQHSLELELEKTRIGAPFDGVVARRYVRAGQMVARDERLFWITATAPLRIRFTLPSRFVNRIKVGQPLEISVPDGSTGVDRAARVIEMSPVVDPASGTIEVLAELVGPTSDLRPGMQADIHLPSRP